MPKALFVSLPLHGHTNPTLPLVRALVRAGHDVHYLSVDGFADAVRAAGARFIRYRSASVANFRSIPERMEQLAYAIASTTAEVLEDQLDLLRAERPDYVITDSVAPWGVWIGRILGIPVVTSISTFAVNRHVIAYGMRHGVRPKSLPVLLSKIRYVAKASRVIRRLRKRYGVDGPGAMAAVNSHSDLNIIYTTRYFQPCADTFDERFVFTGPSVPPDLITAPSPDERRSEPLVYASLGTLFNRDASLFRLLFDALASANVRAIVSAGSRNVRPSVPAPPPNVQLVAWVPQLDILRQATVCISHGGMNTVSESLAMGVPLVVLPQMSEQEIVATRVEELVVGIRLGGAHLTPESLAAALSTVATDERIPRAIARMRESFRTAGGVDDAVSAINAFVSKNAVAVR